jgi:quercetin dioxygenase-like cupin family protein
MKTKHVVALGVVLCVVAAALSATQAQQSGTRRTELQQHDLAVPGREVIQVRVELDPGVTFGEHWHPGEEIVYVLEGSLQYQLEGQPPVTLKAGEVLFIPARTIHTATNVGKGNGAELATYIVEKDQPLVVMVTQ